MNNLIGCREQDCGAYFIFYFDFCLYFLKQACQNNNVKESKRGYVQFEKRNRIKGGERKKQNKRESEREAN